MRSIGHVPTEANAAKFSDILAVEGIDNSVEADPEGWAIWIRSEDELERAKELLTAFLLNPQDPRYAGKSDRARQLRQKALAELDEVEQRTFDRRAVFGATVPYGVGALTAVLMCLCLAIAVLAWTGYKERIGAELFITKVEISPGTLTALPGLAEIRNWEFWRLLTPAFIHMEPLHLLFNLMMLLSLGSMIEARIGTGRFGLYVILFGIVSNLAQYHVAGPLFNGFSGINYGLFGYIWARGRLDPRSALYLHPQTVVMMVAWFFLCFTGVVGNVANMAHAAGLGLGLATGFLSSLPARRRRPKD
ncbi:MAG: rhomboid protease GlpG [Verrucomicrobiota bacterium]|jgi:GlpG protein